MMGRFRFSMSRFLLFAPLLAIFLSAGIAGAQIVKSTFIGTIRDASGAVVPGAKVTITNLETNVTNTVTTDDTGNYIVPFLNSGTYSVTAEKSGFETATERSIKLDVAAKVRVDFTMQVGQTTQKIDVQAASPLVETDTSTVDLVVTSKELRELPLLTRNYQALAQLDTTAVTPTPTTSSVGSYIAVLSTGGAYYQVGGQRGAYTSYTVDGIDTNALELQTQSLIPSLDSIQEFKVQSHNFSAEYGRGSVQFTTTTRSGTNTLHGTAYEYVRNDVLDATDFFSNETGQKKSPYRNNQFGFTVGGPVLFPKVYNGKEKTFFFAGFEATRYDVPGATAYAMWPDPAWLQGDFSDLKNADGTPRLIYDPATTRSDGNGGYIRDPFPGNKIPADRLDSVAKATTQFIPAPNAIGIRPDANAVGKVATLSNTNYWIGRLDHNFSERDRIYGRYMQSRENLTSNSLAPLSGAINQSLAYNAMLGETHTFSPRIVNEARIGYNRGFYGALQEGAYGQCITACKDINYVNDVLGIKNIGGGPASWGLPSFSWSGFSGIGGNVDAPFIARTNTYQISDNLIMAFGNHSLKTGFDIRKLRYNQLFGTFNRGGFDFNGQFSELPGVADSGNPFADFMLGLSDTVLGLSGEASGAFHSTMYNFYFQDDWRISSKLTLNLGIRYEYYSPWTEERGRATRFDFGSIPGTCFGYNCPPGRIVTFKPGQPYYDPDRDDWGPRVGFSYAPFGNNKTVIRAAYGIFYSPPDVTDQTYNVLNPPTALNYTFEPANPYTDLATTKLSGLFPAAPPVNPATLVTNDWPLPPLSFYAETKDLPDAIIQQWQFTVQRELSPNLVLEVGYIGSHGYHGAQRINYNQARLDNPGEITDITSRLPYPSLSPFMFISSHFAYNTYNAGTLRMERRFEKGLSLVASYTFAKTLDDAGNFNDMTAFWPQNAWDVRAEKGLSQFDVRNRLTFGYVWELPFGRGKPFGSGIPSVLDGILGGWQVSGITTFQSGTPISVNPSSDASNTGQFSWAERADKVGPVHYMDIRKTGYWFNADAFAVPKLGTFGDSARGALIGPGINNWDLTIAKNFRIKEKTTLQFRAEMFNAYNHTQFSGAGVNTTVGPGLEKLTGLVSAALPPRNMQLALRLEF
jgi:hypothetical protein